MSYMTSHGIQLKLANVFNATYEIAIITLCEVVDMYLVRTPQLQPLQAVHWCYIDILSTFCFLLSLRAQKENKNKEKENKTLFLKK